MGRLQGKKAVVLGAAGKDNMGQVIARRLAAEGATVVVAGRRAEPLEALAKEIGGHYALCDIARRDDVFALAETAKAKMGGVDIAVQAAAIAPLIPFLENTEAQLREMTDILFLGPFYFLQAMIGAMDHGGSIVQISSATATIMLNDHAAYMGAKAGIDHVVRAAANEFGSRGIKINSISPGLTDTPMTAGAKMTPGVFEAFIPSYPLGRVGTSDDIAAGVVWLASDECFMTGQNLHVNGGLTLRRNPNREEIAAAVGAAMAAQAAKA